MLDALWQIGLLARYVEDLHTVLSVIAGVDWQDTGVVPMPLRDPSAVDLKKLRVAFHTDNGIVAPTPDTTSVAGETAKALAEAVGIIEEARPPGIEETYEIYLGLFAADGGAGIEELLRDAGTEDVHPLMSEVLGLQRSNARSIKEFGSLVTRWDRFRSTMLRFMDRFDVVLCPVCAFPGMEHGATYKKLSAFSYTMAYNLTGWPAAVVRAGTSPEGLPIGVQIVARPWREDVALAVAGFIEKALGGYQRPPI